MGTVSAKGAQGYLKREVKNRNQGGVVRPVGRDGKSDSRSGVAARALNQGLASHGGRTPATKTKTKPGQQQATNPTPLQNAAAQDPLAPAPIQLKVTPNGTLELPYNQSFSSDALQAFKEGNDELLSLQQEEQAMQQEVMQGRRDADTQYGQLKTQTLSTAGGGGTTFSSAHGKRIADDATAYSNTLADISKREADFTQNASARRAAIQSALAMQLAEGAQGYGDELNEEAGDLGYGDYSGESHSHNDNKNRVGSKNKNKKSEPKKDNKPAKKGKK
jgi:hypothetical protein